MKMKKKAWGNVFADVLIYFTVAYSYIFQSRWIELMNPDGLRLICMVYKHHLP